MTDKIVIAVDAMGGDQGPPVVIPAALDALKQFPALSLILVGDQQKLQPHIQAYPDYASFQSRYVIEHTEEHVLMDEAPALALRNKKRSSMRLAINCVKEGRAQAAVSAGNTGALMATARFVLKTLPGIDRPALVYSIPCTEPGQSTRVLDLGANVDCTAEHLLQFGIMGAVLAQSVGNVAHPHVGLLNIGSEDIKGCESVRLAAKLLEEAPGIDYIGFVEGTQLYKGVADVIVCDGFVGNVALKSAEGTSALLLGLFKDAFQSSWRGRIAGLLAKPLLKAVKDRYDPRSHNGACLLGLNGTVMKSHGNADRASYLKAIEQGFIAAQKNVPEQIRFAIESHLK